MTKKKLIIELRNNSLVPVRDLRNKSITYLITRNINDPATEDNIKVTIP